MIIRSSKIFFLNIWYFCNKSPTNHHFCLKSTGTAANPSTASLYTLVFKSFKLFGTFFNSEISNLTTVAFKSAKSVVLIYQHLSCFLTQILLHNKTNLVQVLFCFWKYLYETIWFWKISLILYNSIFVINPTIKWIIIIFPFDI